MSKEYIEKEAAIDYLTLNMNWYDEDGGQVDDWDERKAIISDLLDGIPPAEVKPVFRGEWVIEETVEIGGIWVKWCCDECGYVRTQGWKFTKDGKKPKAKYCENCGADMRKEANDGR